MRSTRLLSLGSRFIAVAMAALSLGLPSPATTLAAAPRARTAIAAVFTKQALAAPAASVPRRLGVVDAACRLIQFLWEAYDPSTLGMLGGSFGDGGRRPPDASDRRDAERYGIVIDWAEYVLSHYRSRFGGNVLIFVGGATRRAYQAALALAPSRGVDRRKILHMDVLPEALPRMPAEDLRRLFAQQGAFDSDGPITLLGLLPEHGTPLQAFEEAIAADPIRRDVGPYFLSNPFGWSYRDDVHSHGEAAIHDAALFLAAQPADGADRDDRLFQSLLDERLADATLAPVLNGDAPTPYLSRARQYARYDANRRYFDPLLRDVVLDAVVKGLPPGATVLELGSGGGKARSLIGGDWPGGARWIESDVYGAALTQPRQHASEKVQFRLPEWPFREERFDAVAGLSSWDTLDKASLRSTVAHAAGSLKPGGRLVHVLDVFPNDFWAMVAESGAIPFPLFEQVRAAPDLVARMLNGVRVLSARRLREWLHTTGDPTLQGWFDAYVKNPAQYMLGLQVDSQAERVEELASLLDGVPGLVVAHIPSVINFFHDNLRDAAREAGLVDPKVEVVRRMMRLSRLVLPEIPAGFNRLVYWHGRGRFLFSPELAAQAPDFVEVDMTVSVFSAHKALRRSA